MAQDRWEAGRVPEDEEVGPLVAWKPLRPMATLLVASTVAGCTGVVAGCTGMTARTTEAVALAQEFEQAVHDGRPAEACALLAPETRSELEESGRMACGPALAQEQLPVGGPVRGTDVYGRQAIVTLSGDTLFLSRFDAGWRVVAAGCVPEPDKPYQCTVKGG